VRRGLRAGSDCQMPRRMSAPAVLSVCCFGAGALSLKGQQRSLGQFWHSALVTLRDIK